MPRMCVVDLVHEADKQAAFRTPRAELIAASDKISENVTRAKGELPPSTE
jgi:hypothetical protein